MVFALLVEQEENLVGSGRTIPKQEWMKSSDLHLERDRRRLFSGSSSTSADVSAVSRQLLPVSIIKQLPEHFAAFLQRVMTDAQLLGSSSVRVILTSPAGCRQPPTLKGFSAVSVNNVQQRCRP